MNGVQQKLADEHLKAFADANALPAGHHVECHYCKLPALRWKQFGPLWRLVTLRGAVHDCRGLGADRHNLKAKEEAAKLMAQGYRRTSRRFCHVARIDRVDWREFMAAEHAPWSIAEGTMWVQLLGDANAADFYRRVYSKDRKTVSRDVSENVAASGCGPTGCDPIGYIDLSEVQDA